MAEVSIVPVAILKMAVYRGNHNQLNKGEKLIVTPPSSDIFFCHIWLWQKSGEAEAVLAKKPGKSIKKIKWIKKKKEKIGTEKSALGTFEHLRIW